MNALPPERMIPARIGPARIEQTKNAFAGYLLALASLASSCREWEPSPHYR
jgi:hypothetical protein